MTFVCVSDISYDRDLNMKVGLDFGPRLRFGKEEE
jgi:hypothetical protein